MSLDSKNIKASEAKAISYIVEHANVPVEKLAKRVRRTEAFVSKILEEFKDGRLDYAEFAQLSSFSKQVLDEKDSRLLARVRSRPYYETVKQQFTAAEVLKFESYWIQYIRQFNEDATFSEESQIVDIIKIEILADRNLAERYKVKSQADKLNDQLAEFIDTNGLGPYNNAKLEAQKINIEMAVKMAEATYLTRTSEYKQLLERKQSYFKDLKATRDQRIDIIESVKTNFVALMQELQREEFTNQEGFELAIMQEASKKDKERLSQPHNYMDGIDDVPLLNAETVTQHLTPQKSM